MRWKGALLGLGMLVSYTWCGPQQRTASHDVPSSSSGSGYVSEEVQDFLRKKDQQPRKSSYPSGIDLENSSIPVSFLDTTISHLYNLNSCGDKYGHIKSLMNRIEDLMGNSSAKMFRNLLGFYEDELRMYNPNSQIVVDIYAIQRQLAHSLFKAAEHSPNVDAFNDTMQLLTLPQVLRVLAKYDLAGKGSRDVITTLSQVAAYTRSTSAVMEVSKCLEAYAEKPESECLNLKFQKLADEFQRYSPPIIEMAQKCQREAAYLMPVLGGSPDGQKALRMERRVF